MQAFRNEVFSAPISFFVLASLRQAVRLACLAAASPEGAEAEASGDGNAGGASAKAPATADRFNDSAAARIKQVGCRSLM